MKKIYILFVLLLQLFTVENAVAQCLAAPNGQWPTAAFTPTCASTCTIQNITTGAWTGEYSVVNVVSGNTYTFRSSVATHFITISNSAGTTAFAFGVGGAAGITWVSTITGTIRFYTHLSSACNSNTTSHTRIVCCVAAAPQPCASNNVNLSITGGSFPGEVSWTLVNPSGTTVASGGAPYNQNVCLPTGCYTFNMVDSYGDGWNGAQYTFTLNGTAIGTGTLSAGASGSAQIGIGTSCAAPTPPANDACANATSLPCGTSGLAGTTVNSVSETAPSGCASPFGVWYTFTGDGQQTTITSTTSFDHELTIVSGSCGSFSAVACVDNSTGTESYTFTTLNGVQYYIYVAHWSTSSTTTGTFNISRTCIAVTPPPANDNCANAQSVTIQCPATATAISGTTANATEEAMADPSCDGGTIRDVWYTFNSGNNTSVNLSVTLGTASWLGGEIHTTCGNPALGLTIGGNAGSCDFNLLYPSPTSITGLTPNTTYRLRLFTNVDWDVAGTFTFTLTSQNNPGAISVPASICVGTATSISNVTAATGAPGSVNYYFYYRGGPSNVTWQMYDGPTTNTSSSLPTTVINTPGTWFIARNSDFGCGQANNASTLDLQMIVTSPPSAGTLSGTQNLCVGGSTTFSSTANGGSWSSSNTAVATINTSTGEINGVAAGIATITYTVTGSGGCTNATDTRTVIVNELPTTSAGPSLAAICQGSTSAAMDGSVGGGATGGSWSGGAGTWTNANNPATATYTASASESGTITLTLITSGGSCGTTSVSKTIVVNQTRIVNSGVSASTPTLCLSTPLSTITHTTSFVTGITSTSGLPAGVTASYANNVITISGTPTTSGIYNYTITPDGCGSATATGQIEVQAPEPMIQVASNSAAIGDYLWNGLVSNDWNQVSNWYVKTGTDTYASATVSPSLQDNVFVVPNSVGGTCVSTDNNPVVNVLSMGSGTTSDVIVHPLAHLTLSPNTVLEVSGNFEGHGNISFGSGSKLKFTGNDSTTFQIANPGNSVIYNLEMSKTNAVVLLSDIYVSNEVLFNGGNIRLNLRTMDLGSTGFFTNENENSYAYCDCIDAKIVRTVNIGAGQTVNTGNLGLSITPELNMGTVRVERYHKKIIEPSNGLSESIARYYSVKDIAGGSVQNNGNLNATLIFNYLNAESSQSNAQLSLYHQTVSNTAWTNLGGSHDPAGKIVTYNNFQSFSFVTLGPTGSALPVTLTSFNANCDKDRVAIRWTTASEFNASHYILQNSRDGINWLDVTEVNASGSTSQESNYGYEDIKLAGLSYYRLVQVDYDGKEEFFGPISVDCENSSNEVKVYPNPTVSEFTVEINSLKDAKNTTVQLTDVMGKVISSRVIDVSAGTNHVYFQETFESGTYLIRILHGTIEFETVKVVVKH